MSVRRIGNRPPGRPLMGAEPLNERLTVMVSKSMMSHLKSRSSGHVAEYVRRALGRSLSVGKSVGRARGRKKVRRGTRRIRRFR